MPVGGRINRRENLRSKKNDTKENVINDKKKTNKSKKEIKGSIRNTQDVETKTSNLIENTAQINNEKFTLNINNEKELGSSLVAELMLNKISSKRKAKDLDLMTEVNDKKLGTPIKKLRLIEQKILTVSIEKSAGDVEIKENGKDDNPLNIKNSSKGLNVIETPRRGRRKITEKVIENDMKEKNDEENKINENGLILSNVPVKDFNVTTRQKLAKKVENKEKDQKLIQNISPLSDTIDGKSLNDKKLPKIIEETPKRGRRRAAEVIESQSEIVEENKTNKNDLEVGDLSLNKNEPQILKSDNLQNAKNNINEKVEFNNKEVDQLKDCGRKTRRPANITLKQIKKTETTSVTQIVEIAKEDETILPIVANVKSPVKELKREEVILTKKKHISKDEVSEKKVEISGKCPGLVMLENIRNRKSQLLLLNEKSKEIASGRKKIEDSLTLKVETSKINDTVFSDDKVAEKPESSIHLRGKAKANKFVEHKDVDSECVQNFTDLDNAMEVDEIEENKIEINTKSMLDKKPRKTGEIKISEKKVPRLKAKPVAKNTVEPAKEQINPGLRMFEALKNRKSENITTLATEQQPKKPTDLTECQQKIKNNIQSGSELTNQEMNLEDEIECEKQSGNEKIPQISKIKELKNPKLVNKRLINNKEMTLSGKRTTFSSDLAEPALKPKPVKQLSSSNSSEKVPGLSTIHELKKRKSDLLTQKCELPLAVKSETTVPPQQKSIQPSSELKNQEVSLQENKMCEKDSDNEKIPQMSTIQELKNPKLVNKRLINNKEITSSGKKTTYSSDLAEPALKKVLKPKSVEQLSSSNSSEKVPGLSTIHELKKRKSDLLTQKCELPLAVKSETTLPPQQNLSESISSKFEITKNQRPVAGILAKPSPFKKPSDIRNSSFTPIGFQRNPNTERRQSVTFNREVEVKEILGNSFNSITDDVPMTEKTKDEMIFEEKLNRELERTKNFLSEKHGRSLSSSKSLNSSFIGSSSSFLGRSQNKPFIKKSSDLSQLISQRYKNSSSPTQQPIYSSFQATPMADSNASTSISESLFASTKNLFSSQSSILTNSGPGIHSNPLSTNSRSDFPQKNWKSFQPHSTTKVLKSVEDLNDSRSSQLSDSSVEGGQNESKSNCMLM